MPSHHCRYMGFESIMLLLVPAVIKSVIVKLRDNDGNNPAIILWNDLNTHLLRFSWILIKHALLSLWNPYHVGWVIKCNNNNNNNNNQICYLRNGFSPFTHRFTILKLVQLMRRITYTLTCSIMERSLLGHKPDCQLGWYSKRVKTSMDGCHSDSAACRPVDMRLWHQRTSVNS